MSMYQVSNTEPIAPDGMIRFIGEEKRIPFFIGDEDGPLTKQEIADIAHMNRGVGITVFVYDDEGKLLHTE